MKDTKRAVDIVMELLDVVEPAQEDVMEDASGSFFEDTRYPGGYGCCFDTVDSCELKHSKP